MRESAGQRDSARLSDLMRAAIARILRGLERHDWSRVVIDFYLHDEVGWTFVRKDLPLQAGCGFAGVMPIWHRPYVQMCYGDAWSLDRAAPGMPSFRDVAANELVKAYLLRAIPRLAAALDTRIGWIEEGMAAYLQGPTFDDYDLDVWASAILRLDAAVALEQLLDARFVVHDWTDSDRIVFDRILIRQLGSFWRYWNMRNGMTRFHAYHRQRYRLAKPRLWRSAAPSHDPFTAVYGVPVAEADTHWRLDLARGRQDVPAAVVRTVEPAAAALQESRWRDRSASRGC